MINREAGQPGVKGARTDQARGASRLARTLRLWLLVAIGCDLALLAVRAASYPAYFSMPGRLSYLFEPVVAFAIYGAIAFALPRLGARFPGSPAALRVGITAGLIGGTLDVASTALESFATLPQRVIAVTTGAAMLGLFLVFGVAGFLGATRSRSFWLGIGAAVATAVVAAMIVVTFGLILVNTSLPALAHGEIGDPDYLLSGWTDVQAFAIANTYDAAFTHLTEAPVIAAVLGAVGSGLGRIRTRRRPVLPG